MLQETKLSQEEADKIKARWIGQVECSPAVGKKRGVITLLSKSSGLSLVSTQRDEDGRMLILTLKRGGDTVHVANIYGPNTDNTTFWEGVSSRLELLPQEDLMVLVGDFNQTMDNTIDRHPQRSSHTTHSPIKNLCTRHNLRDPWRLQHPDAREYTFYSSPHNSYSRIDYILISSTHTHLIEHSEIAARIISDHSCISLLLSGKHNAERTRRWRFNKDVLKDDANRIKIEHAIEEYLINNDTQDTNTGVTWEALKAAIRGVVIDIKAKLNKTANTQLAELEQEIKTLENSHSADLNDSNTLNDLVRKKYTYNKILSERAGVWVARYKAINLCEANKAGKILASYLRHKQRHQTVVAITDTNSTSNTSNKGILQVFKDFYKELYSEDKGLLPDGGAKYLSGRNLPQITEEDRTRLGSEITEAEIEAAIRALKDNKAPGPDGFTACFYKTFRETLKPTQKKTFNYCAQRGSVTKTMAEADIIVIPKEGKDAQYPQNYRPISLINVDCKIYAKILSRLNALLPKLINKAQVGFLKNRLSHDNTRLLCHLLSHAATSTTPTIMIALDAEKTFDRVSWPFLSNCMAAFNLGDTFTRKVMALYSEPTARVVINGGGLRALQARKRDQAGLPALPGTLPAGPGTSTKRHTGKRQNSRD